MRGFSALIICGLCLTLLLTTALAESAAGLRWTAPVGWKTESLRPMRAATYTVPGYRLLGAIVEGPGGNVFVKLTGPAKTVTANQQKFNQLLASFQLEK